MSTTKQMRKGAIAVLAELEALALRDLRRQTERMRSALARAAPRGKGRKDVAAQQGSGEGELAWARLGATEALELWSKVHAACTLAGLEASASAEAEVLRTGQQEEDEQAHGQDEEKEQDGDGQRHAQRQKDRKHWEHEG